MIDCAIRDILEFRSEREGGGSLEILESPLMGLKRLSLWRMRRGGSVPNKFPNQFSNVS